MARKILSKALHLSAEQRARFAELSSSRTAQLREIQRAQIMLLYADGASVSEIKAQVHVSRPTIYKCLDKALGAGPEAGLEDFYHRPFAPRLTMEAKAWVTNLACTKPKEHGLAAELWTLSELAKYTRTQGPPAGHASLSKAAKATIWRILEHNPVKPQKPKYYLERRDSDFEAKMQEVLIAYQEVNLQNDQPPPPGAPLPVITVSIDEEPGVQALRTTAPDLAPQPGKHATWGRDYEYERLGTVSILASLDLHTGHIIAQVHDRHRSCEFISLLQELDAYYPQDATIRVILDNHSAHTSKETMRYLATRPNRFIYVHTPKHGSWLNLVESVFSKMARTFFRHIRVQSKQELKEPILKGIDEFNAAPVVYRWKKSDSLLV
jgi:transposase